MASELRCPNPNCPHVFPAEAVAGQAAIVCPACGGVFQRPAPQAVVKEKTIPIGRGVRPADGGFVRWLSVGAVAFGLGSLAFAVWFIYGRKPAVDRPEPFRSPQYNYSFLPPSPPWQQDSGLRDPAFVIALNFRRTAPDSHFLLAVRDGKIGYPNDRELRESGIHLLKQVVGLSHLEIESRSNAELAGQAARRWVFQADRNETQMSGDLHALRYQGFAYWMVRMCPAKDVTDAQAELDNLRDRFSLLEQRPDWQPSRQRFAASKSGLALTGEGERWGQPPFPAEQYDPRAVLVLESREHGSPAGDRSRRATMTVLILVADDGEPVARARAYLLERQREEFPNAKVVDLPASSEVPKSELPSATILPLKVEHDSNRERFVWLAVVPNGREVVVLQGESGFDRREVWEPEFQRLAATLELAK